MAFRRTLVVFGPLAAVAHGISLALTHRAGYHFAASGNSAVGSHVVVHDPAYQIPLELLGIGLYAAAGFVAARRRLYISILAGATVAGVAYVLGTVAAFLVVPGASEFLVDTTFWAEDIRYSGVPRVAVGAACGVLGAAVSRIPFLRGQSPEYRLSSGPQPAIGRSA